MADSIAKIIAAHPKLIAALKCDYSKEGLMMIPMPYSKGLEMFLTALANASGQKRTPGDLFIVHEYIGNEDNLQANPLYALLKPRAEALLQGSKDVALTLPWHQDKTDKSFYIHSDELPPIYERHLERLMYAKEGVTFAKDKFIVREFTLVEGQRVHNPLHENLSGVLKSERAKSERMRRLAKEMLQWFEVTPYDHLLYDRFGIGVPAHGKPLYHLVPKAALTFGNEQRLIAKALEIVLIYDIADIPVPPGAKILYDHMPDHGQIYAVDHIFQLEMNHAAKISR